MKLFQRYRAGLSKHMRQAEGAGWTSVALEGTDVGSAIAEETKAKRLETALAAARKHHEAPWIECCLRRLHKVRGEPQDALSLAHQLASQGELEESQQLFSGLTAQVKESQNGREVQANIAAKQGHTEEALSLLGMGSGQSDQAPPSPQLLALASETLMQATIEDSLALITRLEAIYPESLSLRGLCIRAHLYKGNCADVDALSSVSGEELARANAADRRSIKNAIAETYAHRGWMNELFEFCRLSLSQDPGHWSLYGQAATAAHSLAREAEFEEILEALPDGMRNTPAEHAELARWHMINQRPEQAEEMISRLRQNSAARYLSAVLQKCLSRQDLPGMRKAYEDSLKCGLPALWPTLSYCLYAYNYDAEEESLQAALDLLEPFKATARHNAGFWQLVLRCETAVGNTENVRALYAGLPEGLQTAAKLAPFEMYLDAVDGKHQQARSKWVHCIRQTRHSCVNARSSYPATLKLRYEETEGAILAFSMVYNGAPHLDWYLDHYRSLGVDHFFIVDNGSDDGTCERLLAQPDVSVFSCLGNFAEAAFGVIWINHLLQRFGVGHWCFHVDIDEGFVFPGQDRGKTLKDLLKYCDTYEYSTLRGAAIDIYPADVAGKNGITSISDCTHFDADYTSLRSELPPYYTVQGGVRKRMTGLALSVNKTPLVRMEPDVFYTNGSHNTTHLPVADVTVALLHYKFVGDVRDEIRKTVKRGTHAAGAVSYRRLHATFEEAGWDHSLICEHSRRLDGSSSLEHHGLMKTSEIWEEFTN